MRYLFAPLAALLFLGSVAQTSFDREVILEVDSTTPASTLQAAARKWFVDTFKDAKEVIQMDDEATNTIVGKGLSKPDPNFGLHYTIEVASKKGRARIRLYNVHHEGIGGITVGTSYQPYLSWGALVDEPECYSIPDKPSYVKQRLKRCEFIRPAVSSSINGLVLSLEAALNVSIGLPSLSFA